VKLGSPLKEKFLSITVTLGAFESKIFTHHNNCCGPFVIKVAYLYIAVAVGLLCKQGTLHITVGKGGSRQKLCWT